MINPFGEMPINFTVEILRGCGYSCSDCAVDKDYIKDNISDVDTDDLIKLVHDLKANGARLFEFTLGPTDFVSSDNGFSLLKHRLVETIGGEYESLTVSLTLLSDNNLELLGGMIGELIPNKRFRLVVPVLVKNLKNQKYLEVLKRRVGLIKDNLGTTTFHQLYINSNMVEENIKELSFDNLDVTGNFDFGVRTTIEHGFGHGRKDLNNLILRDKYLRDLLHYAEKINEVGDTRYCRPLVSKGVEGTDLTYRAGKLYYNPIVIEKFPCFDPFFEIPKPWTAETILEFVNNLHYENLAQFVNHPECGDCCFNNLCSINGNHTLMRYLKHDRCLVGMKNRVDLVKH